MTLGQVISPLGHYGDDGSADIADLREDEVSKSTTSLGLGAQGEGRSHMLICFEAKLPPKDLYPLVSQPQAFIFFDDTCARVPGGWEKSYYFLLLSGNEPPPPSLIAPPPLQLHSRQGQEGGGDALTRGAELITVPFVEAPPSLQTN